MGELITEAMFQQTVIELARLNGWLVHHTRPALNRSGKWATPIQGDPGFPDLVLARGGELLIVELKSQKGELTPGQFEWLTTLAAVEAAVGPEKLIVGIFVWKPSMWDSIERTLR